MMSPQAPSTCQDRLGDRYFRLDYECGDDVDVLILIRYWLSTFLITFWSFSPQMNMDLPVAEGHLCNMGRMIEEMESKLRYSLDQVCESEILPYLSSMQFHQARDSFKYIASFAGIFWEDERDGLYIATTIWTRSNETTRTAEQATFLKRWTAFVMFSGTIMFYLSYFTHILGFISFDNLYECCER